jgi:hypothetical protein
MIVSLGMAANGMGSGAVQRLLSFPSSDVLLRMLPALAFLSARCALGMSIAESLWGENGPEAVRQCRTYGSAHSLSILLYIARLA